MEKGKEKDDKNKNPRYKTSYVVGFSLRETYDDLVTAQQMICKKHSSLENTNSMSPTTSVGFCDEDNKFLDSNTTLKGDSKYLLASDLDVTNNEELKKTSAAFKFDNTSSDDKMLNFYSPLESMIDTNVTDAVPDTTLNICYELSSDSALPMLQPNTGRHLQCDTPCISQHENNFTGDNTSFFGCIIDTPKPSYDSATKFDCPLESKVDDKIIEILREDGASDQLSNQQLNSGTMLLIYNSSIPSKAEENNIKPIGDCTEIVENEEPTAENNQSSEIIFKKSDDHTKPECKPCKKPRIKRKKTAGKAYYHCKLSRIFKKVPYNKNVGMSKINSKVKSVFENTNLSNDSDQMSLIYNNFIGSCSSRRITSYPFNTGESLSNNTLTGKASKSSYSNECETEAVNSVIEIISFKKDTPYKNDVTIATAQTSSSKTLNALDITTKKVNKYEPLIKKKQLDTSPGRNSSARSDPASDVTLINNISNSFKHDTTDMSDSDLNSSDCGQYSFGSAFTYTSPVTDSDVEKEDISARTSQNIQSATVFKSTDTIITVNDFEVTPSTSSPKDCNYAIKKSKQGIAKITVNENSPERFMNSIVNVLHKSIKQDTNNVKNKSKITPNFAEFEKLCTDKEILHKNCAMEATNVCSVNEMWEKFLIVLNISLKSIEDSIPEKIIKEINRSFKDMEMTRFPKNQDLELGGDYTNTNKPVERTLSPKVSENLQCSLIDNISIDKIMQKICKDPNKLTSAKPSVSLSKLRPKILEELMEVLKPFHDPIILGKDKVENIISAGTSIHSNFFQSLNYILTVPWDFLKENMIILASVGMFISISLCLYGFIFVIMTVI